MKNSRCYVDVSSDKNVSSMFGSAIANGLQMVELYLTSRSRRENQTSIEWTASPSDLGGNTKEYKKL